MPQPRIPKMMGARVLVRELVTSLSLVERGKLSGLTVVAAEENTPKPTTGEIVALGTDPFLVENGLYVGAEVTFAPHAGKYQYVDGVTYRSLEFEEIISIVPPVEQEPQESSSKEETPQ